MITGAGLNLSLCMPWRHIGNMGIALFIQVCIRWRCTVNFMPWPFDPCKNNIWYPQDGKYGWSHGQPGHLGDEKNTCSCREVNPGLSSPLHRHCNYWAVSVACYMIKWRRMSVIPNMKGRKVIKGMAWRAEKLPHIRRLGHGSDKGRWWTPRE